jgi:hypothetical protein
VNSRLNHVEVSAVPTSIKILTRDDDESKDTDSEVPIFIS